jgi:hypothetical protein
MTIHTYLIHQFGRKKWQKKTTTKNEKKKTTKNEKKKQKE